MKISERLLAWQVLLSLSEGKGFSLAADKFGRDEAFYCRLTHGLETEIGIRLTEPHSRPVRLTQDAIELLPEIYQKIYRFFPFPYAIDAMRECICGMYGSYYGQQLAFLLLFAAAALLIGLLVRRPFMGLNHFMEEKLEETELL